MTVPQALTNDDLIWFIGQKEATLLLVTRQAQALLAETERLQAEVTALKTPPPPTPAEDHVSDHG